MEKRSYPEGDSQLAWVRWTTPDTPQDMVITVRVSGPGNAQGTINCKIVDLDQNPPPNPVADDRNDSFTPSSIPNREQKTSNYPKKIKRSVPHEHTENRPHPQTGHYDSG